MRLKSDNACPAFGRAYEIGNLDRARLRGFKAGSPSHILICPVKEYWAPYSSVF